jgi:hypothetical protein
MTKLQIANQAIMIYSVRINNHLRTHQALKSHQESLNLINVSNQETQH